MEGVLSFVGVQAVRASVRTPNTKDELLRRCHQAPKICFTSIFFSKVEASYLLVLIIRIIILIKILIIQKYRQMTVKSEIYL